MTPSHEDPEAQPDSSLEPLGRAWIGPALLVAGVLGLVRAELLVRLGLHHGAESLETARWVALAQWPALIVQSVLMAAATAAIVWSARGFRLVVALVIGAAFLTSAVSGWPVAPMNQILQGTEEGLPGFATIGAAGALVGVFIAALAWFCRRSASLERVMGSYVFLILTALPALGIPSYLLWQDSLQVPQMQVREVLAQLHSAEHWAVLQEDPAAPARGEFFSPLAQGSHPFEGVDTSAKPALLMSPPCEVQAKIPDGAEGATLSLAAQISGNPMGARGAPGEGLESEWNRLGVDAISVRFQVLLDGNAVFDSVIHHGAEVQAAARAWQDFKLDVAPGQLVTLRTDFADEDTARVFDGRELRCGFGEITLDRWGTRPRTHANPEEPNLLFITIDTLRADRLSSYGYEKPTTPNIDAIGREGMLFERAFATSSWTGSSTGSLFTGLSPHEHGVLSQRRSHLAHAHQTLAEALQESGVTTAAIAGSPWIHRAHGFDQGIESFDSAQTLRTGEDLIDGIESKLREIAHTRFYLYVHLTDPQTPHAVMDSELKRLGGKQPEDFANAVPGESATDALDTYAERLARGDATDEYGVIRPNTIVPEAHAQWISDRYDASIGTADHYVGRILRLLSDLELDEITVIALTSNHGEELLEHNMYGHGHGLHREQVHVPLLLAGRGCRLASESKRKCRTVTSRRPSQSWVDRRWLLLEARST